MGEADEEGQGERLALRLGEWEGEGVAVIQGEGVEGVVALFEGLWE